MSIPEPRALPRLLIIDDLFGRSVSPFNEERANLCARFLLQDITDDSEPEVKLRKVVDPRAEAIFVRGQTPSRAAVGDIVENSIESCREAVVRGWDPDRGILSWALVLVDLCFYTGPVTRESHQRASGMPEGRPGDDRPKDYFGLKIVADLREHFRELPVIILSSMSREDVSREFSELGALGFIPRSGPDSPRILDDLLWQHGLLPDYAEEVSGNSLPILMALREARRASRHRENLLIRGERGTGKELLARFIHRMSDDFKADKERPFVTVNSAVFTPNLFTSELFGIEPRTATGVDGKVGLVEMADRGDLFLDEIADMPLDVQASVLRVLQEHQITRVGSRQPMDVLVRFLSATNADIENESSGLRSDLLDRLRLGGTIWLPPLRERATDIPLLAAKFVREAESRRKGALRRDITPEALEILCTHDWLGNIRELRSVIFDAVNRFPDVEHLVPVHLRVGSGKDGRGVGRPMQETKRAAADGMNAEVQQADFDTLFRQLAGTEFDARDLGQWAGRLGEIQYEHTRLVARMLQAALEATKRRTPEKPEGTIQIHPALRLLTGDPALTASQAADVLKRLLGPLEYELEGDLRAAYETALRLRPKSARISSRRGATTDD